MADKVAIQWPVVMGEMLAAVGWVWVALQQIRAMQIPSLSREQGALAAMDKAAAVSISAAAAAAALIAAHLIQVSAASMQILEPIMGVMELKGEESARL